MTGESAPDDGEGVEKIKHGRAPTVAQKKLLKKWRLDPENWLIVKISRTGWRSYTGMGKPGG